ncbi:MAG: DUF2730 domain-containing protein [Candidatus Methylomirabilis sp.]|nr:DUF2730 domain-containing protein [Deltaproteobacteria bacterium]
MTFGPEFQLAIIVGQWLFNVLVAVGGFFGKRQLAEYDRSHAHHYAASAVHAERITRLEASIGAMPTHQEISALNASIQGLTAEIGDLKAATASAKELAGAAKHLSDMLAENEFREGRGK